MGMNCLLLFAGDNACWLSSRICSSAFMSYHGYGADPGSSKLPGNGQKGEAAAGSAAQGITEQICLEEVLSSSAQQHYVFKDKYAFACIDQDRVPLWLRLNCFTQH